MVLPTGATIDRPPDSIEYPPHPLSPKDKALEMSIVGGLGITIQWTLGLALALALASNCRVWPRMAPDGLGWPHLGPGFFPPGASQFSPPF